MIYIKLLILLVLPVIVGFCANMTNETIATYLQSFSSYNDWISICFTSGSIIFAIQSFLIPFMRQSLYNTKTYIAYLKAEYKNNWKSEQYRPLKNLSEFLFVTTSSAFISIIFMVIFFFTRNLGILLISFYYGLASFIGLICALIAMKNNFDIMFTYNKDSEK